MNQGKNAGDAPLKKRVILPALLAFALCAAIALANAAQSFALAA